MRTEKVVIRLSRAERAAVKKLASVENLPPATLARRLLLQEARKHGLWSVPQIQAQEGSDA